MRFGKAERGFEGWGCSGGALGAWEEGGDLRGPWQGLGDIGSGLEGVWVTRERV